MVIRRRLFQPGLQLVQPEFSTDDHHARLIMVFGASCRAFVGLPLDDPMMHRAPDSGSARMNNFSFWLLPALRRWSSTLFHEGGRADFAGPSTRHCPRPNAPPSVTSHFFASWRVSVSIMVRSYHRDHPQPARPPGHDADEDAVVPSGPGLNSLASC